MSAASEDRNISEDQLFPALFPDVKPGIEQIEEELDEVDAKLKGNLQARLNKHEDGHRLSGLKPFEHHQRVVNASNRDLIKQYNNVRSDIRTKLATVQSRAGANLQSIQQSTNLIQPFYPDHIAYAEKIRQYVDSNFPGNNLVIVHSTEEINIIKGLNPSYHCYVDAEIEREMCYPLDFKPGDSIYVNNDPALFSSPVQSSSISDLGDDELLPYPNSEVLPPSEIPEDELDEVELDEGEPDIVPEPIGAPDNGGNCPPPVINVSCPPPIVQVAAPTVNVNPIINVVSPGSPPPPPPPPQPPPIPEEIPEPEPEDEEIPDEEPIPEEIEEPIGSPPEEGPEEEDKEEDKKEEEPLCNDPCEYVPKASNIFENILDAMGFDKPFVIEYASEIVILEKFFDADRDIGTIKIADNLMDE